MIKIVNNFVERFNLRDHQLAYYDLIKLIFMIVFVAHISACTLNLVAQIEEGNQIEYTWT